MQPDLRCYHHPEREATGQCDRCGDYLCAECQRELANKQLCDRCRTELHPSTLKTHLGTLSTFHYVVGIMTAMTCCGMLSIMAPVIGRMQERDGDSAMATVLTVLVFLLILLLTVGLGALQFLSGWYLIRGRRYKFCRIVAMVSLISVPQGTVLGIFTLMALARPEVQELFFLDRPHPNEPLYPGSSRAT